MNLKIIQNNCHIVCRKGFLIGQRTAVKWNRDGKYNSLSGDIVHDEFVIRVFVAVCKFACVYACGTADACACGTADACACGTADACACGTADACPPCCKQCIMNQVMNCRIIISEGHFY